MFEEIVRCHCFVEGIVYRGVGVVMWEVGQKQRLCVAFAIGYDAIDGEGSKFLVLVNEGEGECTNIMVFVDGGGELLEIEGWI